MTHNVTVVLGTGTSPLGTLPFQSGDYEGFDSRMFSKKNYGNYLPELWSYMKTLALDPSLIATVHTIAAVKEKGWAVVTDSVDGLAHQAGITPLYETSGSIFRGKCLRCETLRELTRNDYETLPEGEVFSCLKCGKDRVRPDVVLEEEWPHHRKIIDDVIYSRDLVVFVDVDEFTHEAKHWANLSRDLIIVAKEPGEINADRRFESGEDWALKGCPLERVKA